VRATPVALYLRDQGRAWRVLAGVDRAPTALIGELGRRILAALDARGAQFTHEIVSALGASALDVREALAELVWAGLAASDGFAGLRAIWDGEKRNRGGGRWSRIAGETATERDREAAIEHYAATLLTRYGIMCRRLLAREPYAVPWRELLRVYRRLEARGDVRGGRFVSGLPGEQFALPEAVELARQVRRTKPSGEAIVISAADPLNLCGIITPGDRVPAIASTRITFRDGTLVAPDEQGSELVYG
jgi:ATP-dependent Lhr-like helicase